MNPTSLEYLYQITPPVSDRAPTTSRSDNDATGFDNHLSQATSTVFDIVRSPNQPASRPSYSPTSRSTSDNDDASPNDPATRAASSKPLQNDNSPDDSSTQSNSAPTSEKSSSASQRDDSHEDKRDQDKSDDTHASAAAGAAQPVVKDSAISPANTKKEAEPGATDEAKDKIAADALSKVPIPGTKGEAAKDTKTADKTDVGATELNADVIVPKTSKDAPGDAKSDEVKASAKNEATTAKSAKTPARSVKAKATSAASDQEQHASQSSKSSKADPTGSDPATAATASETSAAPAISETNSLADQTDAKSDTAAPGQSSRAHKDAVSDNAPTDVPATPTSTSAPTAVANITTPAQVEAIADKPKQSDGDASKPVTAKTDATVGPLGRTLRTDLTGGSKTSTAGDSSTVDVARFVSRVAKAVQTANDRDGVVQLRLSPPDLGSLKIQLTVKDGVMSAALEADNSNARQMLLDHLPTLRDRLAEQNIRVDRFDVDVKQENTGGQANPRGSNQNPYQQQAQETAPRRGAAKDSQVSEASPVDTAAAAPRINATGINLVI